MSKHQASSSSGAAGGKMLPQRSTRGKRMASALDEDDADNEFWNQEFFAEEAQDVDYQTEEEEEDVPDSDFDEPESDDDEDEADRDVDEKPKRKALKAPEPKGPPKPKAPKPPASASKAKDGEGSEQPPNKKQAVQQDSPTIPADQLVYAAPTLRRSTMARVAQAEVRRAEQTKAQTGRAPPRKGSEWRPMTQAELLAEAARTEIDNMYSLKMLLAIEEATKKKAQVVKQQYTGPIVRWVSRRRVAITQPPRARDLAGAASQQQQPPTEQAQAPAHTGAAAAAATAIPSQPAGAGAAAAAAQQQGAQAGGSSAGAALQGGSQPHQPPDVHMADANAGSVSASQAVIENGVSAAQEPAAASGSPGQGKAADGGGKSEGKTCEAKAADKGDTAAAASGRAGSEVAEGASEQEAGGRQKKDDETQYEATLAYELLNMHYPPLWLRRFRAPPPPVPPLCLVSGAPARYRDPETGVCFSSVAAYRRIKGTAPPPFPSSGAPLSLPLNKAAFNRSTCAFQGAPQRQVLSPAAQRAMAALPPEPAALPPPSVHFAMIQPNALPGPLMALVVETAQA